MRKTYLKPLAKRIEAILLNITHLNGLNKLLLFIGSRVLLRRLFSKVVLKTLLNELTKWNLISPD